MFDVVGAFRAVVASVAARSRVALRKNVHRPAAHELGARQRERLGRVALGLFFATSPEGHQTVVVRDQSPVGDRAARHIPSQVLQHMCRLALAVGWAFDEDVPIGRGEVIEPRF